MLLGRLVVGLITIGPLPEGARVYEPSDAEPADRLDDPFKVAPGAVASWFPVADPAEIVPLPDKLAPGAVASPVAPPVAAPAESEPTPVNVAPGAVAFCCPDAVPAEIDEVPVSVTPAAVALTAPTATVAVSLPIRTLSASTL